MDATGRCMGPDLKWGLSCPSYSNFDSISCTDDTLAGLSLEPSRRVLALKVGMKSEKGRSMVCQVSALVSKLLRAAAAVEGEGPGRQREGGWRRDRTGQDRRNRQSSANKTVILLAAASGI